MKRIILILALLCWTARLTLSVSPALAAHIVWQGDVSTIWQVGANWVGDEQPGVDDIAHFNGVSDVNCVMDGGINVLGVQVDAGYTGTINFTAGPPAEHEVGGSGIVTKGGTIDPGDSAWIVSGNLDIDVWGVFTGTQTLSGTADQVVASGVDIGTWIINKTTSGKVTVGTAEFTLGAVDMVGDGTNAFVATAATIDSTVDAKNFVGAAANEADVNFSSAGNDITLAGTWTITNGDWVTVNAGAWDRGTSTVAFNGTCTINTGVTNDFYNLTVTSGTSTVLTNSTRVRNVCTIEGTLSIDTSLNVYCAQYFTVGAKADLNVGGRITGDGTFILHIPGSGGGIRTFGAGATFDVANFSIYGPAGGSGSVLVPGNYQSATVVTNAGASDLSVTLDADGTYQFDSLKLFTSSTGTLTLANNTNGPASITVNGDLTFDRDSTGAITVSNAGQATDWVITGDVLNEGAATWTPGTGSISASGTAAQAWDWSAVTGTLEDIVVDKTAETLTLGGGWTANSFTFSDGSLDLNGQTVVTTGDFTVAPGCTFATGGAGLNGADITVGGNFRATGSTTELDMTAAAWTLDVTGGAHCRNVNVTNSDASAGSTIYAFDSIDGAGNDNWVFHPRPNRMRHKFWRGRSRFWGRAGH